MKNPQILFYLMLGVIMGYQPLALSAPKESPQAAIKQAHVHLARMVKRITRFHDAAKISMNDSIDLPSFTEYFNLPESHHNNYDALGRIQLSEHQNKIRKKLEDWILGLHKKFPIGETCLIDNQGQEHLRVVGGKIEKPHHFSSEEHGAPFFSPTLKLNMGEVHISKPYMSADTYYWVVSFTSPIVMLDGTKPAFYHFEVPLKVYSDLISASHFSFTDFTNIEKNTNEEGRYFIFDKKGYVVADSVTPPQLNLVDERHPEINPDLPDYLPPEKLSDYLNKMEYIFPGRDQEELLKRIWQQKQGKIDISLRGQDYVLVFQSVPNRPEWMIAHMDPINGVAFWR